MKIRQGLADDSTWIVKLLIEGANEGHFGQSLKYQAEPFLQSIIENGGINMVKLRETIQAAIFVPMELSVAEIEGTPASFLICCKDNNEVEVHLAATLESFKRKGCFNKLVSATIINHKKSRIYARCYKKSTLAVNGLKKLNFKITKSGDPIELTLSK